MQKVILIILTILVVSRFDLFRQNQQNDKRLIEKKHSSTGTSVSRRNNLIEKRK